MAKKGHIPWNKGKKMTDSYKKAVAKGMKESATYISCNVCGKEVLNVSGRGKYCSLCAKEVQKEQIKKNKQSKKYKEWQKKYEKTRERTEYWKNIGHKKACLKYIKTKKGKKQRDNYKSKRNKDRRLRYKTDINYKLMISIRSRLLSALKRNSKKDSSLVYLGCGINYFKKYLESKFLPRMSWDNHGPVWHIDEIMPCDSFDFTKEENIHKCFHYSNRMPRFATTEIAQQYNSDQVGNINKKAMVTCDV